MHFVVHKKHTMCTCHTPSRVGKARQQVFIFYSFSIFIVFVHHGREESLFIWLKTARWFSGRRFGPAIWRSVGTRTDVRYSPKMVVYGHCHVKLCLLITETFIWHSSLPSLMQKSFWWWLYCAHLLRSGSPSVSLRIQLVLLNKFNEPTFLQLFLFVLLN